LQAEERALLQLKAALVADLISGVRRIGTDVEHALTT
jgi:hypothetical protein